MGVELRPLGVSCNIMCQYCYQNPQRDAGNLRKRYDVEAMLRALDAEQSPFTLFGGEPLMLPHADLERLWTYGLERFGVNRVQTNATLIDDDHIRLFQEYNVQVGISVDGPDELNDARWGGSLARTRDATARTHAAIERLCRLARPPSLIVTLHNGNALPEAWPAMDQWLLRMDEIGINRARLHVLEVDHLGVGKRWAMSDMENAAAFNHFYDLERARLPRLRFDLFEEMRRLLLGDDHETGCVWHACDPYTTEAVSGIEGFGERSNCGRTNKLGIDFVKADVPGFERSWALWHTPQQAGGCAGCRFFAMCKGQCPGTAIDGDWRNRSAQCPLWTALFERIEAGLLADGHVPLSVDARRPALERALLNAWTEGRTVSLAGLIADIPQQASAAPGPSVP
jgi:uncharacterized protein